MQYAREFAKRLGEERKCEHAPCQCRVQGEAQYCSSYCEQAARHGIPREYCQCEHKLALEEVLCAVGGSHTA
jgi:hypothetical protein